MSAEVWISGVVGLAGVAIGGGLQLLGQNLAGNREDLRDQRREAREVAEARRQEKLGAYTDFFEAVGVWQSRVPGSDEEMDAFNTVVTSRTRVEILSDSSTSACVAKLVTAGKARGLAHESVDEEGGKERAHASDNELAQALRQMYLAIRRDLGTDEPGDDLTQSPSTDGGRADG